jgi:hypothetical protein
MAPERDSARKRSQTVALGVVGSLAFALTSCSSPVDKRCVDTQLFKTVADQYCDNSPGKGYADTDRYQWFQSGGDSRYLHGYHRYYGSSRSRGGSDDGSTGHGVTRHGFGGHSGSHGG